jgi:hypothetical protein
VVQVRSRLAQPTPLHRVHGAHGAGGRIEIQTSVDPTEACNTVAVEQVEADAREDAVSQQQPAVACLGPLGDALARRTVAHTSFDRYAPVLEQANPFC